MTRIASIGVVNNSIGFKAQYQTAPIKSETKENSKATEKYLDNLAMINAPAVKKVNAKKTETEIN